MELLISFFLASLFALAATAFPHENITAELLSSQRDMKYAHEYFQMQTSRLAEEFDEAMNLLGWASVPQLAAAADRFNVIYSSTNASLTDGQAHPSCFEDWQLSHRRRGRTLSKCTDQQMEETLLIYNIFHFMAFFGEFLTNLVPMRGIEAFREWQPLTNPAENDPIQFVDDELSWDLIIYHATIYDFLVVITLDVLNSADTFEDLTRTCVSAVIGSLTADAQSILGSASMNQCSRQV